MLAEASPEFRFGGNIQRKITQQKLLINYWQIYLKLQQKFKNFLKSFKIFIKFRKSLEILLNFNLFCKNEKRQM